MVPEMVAQKRWRETCIWVIRTVPFTHRVSYYLTGHMMLMADLTAIVSQSGSTE
jgi:hypothetical protein